MEYDPTSSWSLVPKNQILEYEVQKQRKMMEKILNLQIDLESLDYRDNLEMQPVYLYILFHGPSNN